MKLFDRLECCETNKNIMRAVCGWLILLGVCVSFPSTSQLVWRFREIDEGVKPEIAIDNENNVHVAYMLEARVP